LVLRALALETWVQVAPISLPRLKRGENRCRYAIGDRYGKSTAAMFVTPNAADPTDLAKYVVQTPADYDPDRKTARIRGDVVLRVEAPQGTTIGWFTAGASFATHQNEGANRTDNRIAYAVGAPTNFQEVYRADVPTWVNHWRYQWDEDVLLDQPAQVVFVRYSGRPAVNVVRVTPHLQPAKPPETAIEITHGYRLGGELVEQRVAMPRPGAYTVTVDGEPENVFVRMAVPSVVK
jgi:hypothetical protein